MRQESADPSSLVRTDWKMHLGVPLATWTELRDEIESTTAPPRMSTIHGQMKTVAVQMDEAGDEMANGVRNADSAAIKKATDRVNNANAVLERIPALLGEFQE